MNLARIHAFVLYELYCQNIFRAMSVSHIQRGQKPTKRMTLRVSDDVPVAT